ncbi:helix-turn-helix domain-containing protein [Desulfofalx alkaliphila]|uniref:helix-turn-helix domain-containing protein n=1 Tax=Desulfofalx alkaliphila TaxID=105483 RepID=UPI0004E2005F|nr:helix-turn-helix transcriptional regulator [Desulfofalx alkaliphila]
MSNKELNDIGVVIGQKIKELRLSQGLSMTRLANIAGTSQSYIGDLERARKSVTVKMLYNICNALGVTLEKFINDIESLIPAELDFEQEESAEYNRICSLGKKLTHQELNIVVQLMEQLLKNRAEFNTDVVSHNE